MPSNRLKILILSLFTLILFSSKIFAQNFCTINPTVAQSGLNSSYCLSSSLDTLIGQPLGGIWSGTGMVDSVFNPSLAGVGTHIITYSIGGYAVDTNIIFSPVGGVGTALVMGDDQVQGPLPIGFSFDFFGNTYTDFYLSSNGFLTFNADFNSGCCSGDLLPTTFSPSNLISFCWNDMDPASGGTIDYFTTGIAPNRILVMNFNAVTTFANNIPYTVQVLLYETTNVIEIHVTSIVFDAQLMTMGIENAIGNVAHVVPGRNNNVWSAANQGIRFTPDSCLFSYDDTTVVNNGPENLALSDTCLDLGTIMEFTTAVDSIYLYNTGCDTLFITNITNVLPEFSPSMTNGSILPGDSLLVEITFAPTSSTTFNDTLNIFTSDVDSTICLSGIAIGAPIISVSPPSLAVSTTNCCDTTSTSFTIGNLAPDVGLNWNAVVAPIFTEDFDPLIESTNWTSTVGGIESMGCGADSGNAWLMNGSSSSLREIITKDLDVSVGGVVNFRVYMSNGTDGCNAAESLEDVYLDYSIDGGATWINFGFYDEAIYTPAFVVVSEIIPLAAQTSSTRFRWRQLNFDCTNCDIAMIDDIVIQSSYVSITPTTGTIGALGSTAVNVDFISCGLVAGVYQDTIRITSDDPVTPVVLVPYTFTLNGLPSISTSISCIDMDTAMVTATNIDSFYVYNTGCDTLDVTSIVNALSIFSVDTANFVVPPNDSLNVIVSFSPTVPGSFFDTLIINNNDVTDTICLSGVAVPAPSITVTPASLTVSSSTCCDTTTVQITIDNGSPAASLTWSINTLFGVFEDFDPSTNTNNWSSILGGFSTIACGADNGNAFMMDGAGLRQLITKDLDVTNGGNVDFRLYMSDGTDGCDAAESWEDVYLDYSIDGGTTWINFGFYDEAVYTPSFVTISQAIPFAAQTTSTRFRWRQINHDYAGDAISLFDDISIVSVGFITPSVSFGTTAPSGSTIVDLDFVSCGLDAGVYQDSILISSNDPLNPSVYIPYTYTVVGNPVASYSDTCLFNDSTMELTTSMDTLWILNTGCDTLTITSLSNTLPEYTYSFTSLNTSVRVNQTSDDAEEAIVTGAVDLWSTDLELINDLGVDQFVGMRFRQLDIPQGSIITSAYIEYECDEATNIATSVIFNGENVDNSTTFSTTNFDISTRPLTLASTSWNNISSWFINVKYQTPDLTSVIQEIINRPGWVTGNDLSVIAQGSGVRIAESFDGVSIEAPLLVVKYISSIPVNLSPGDSIGVIVTFSPLSAGNYSDFLFVQTNAGDSNICLNGTAYQAPTISYNPTSINQTINSCCDSITDTITVYNTGFSDLIYSTDIIDTYGILFYDGFESGNINTWVDEGGPYAKQITSTAPALGTYSVEMDGGNYGHLNGISHTFPSGTPDYVSFRVKSSNSATNSTMIVIGDNPTNPTVSILQMYMASNGRFWFRGAWNIGNYISNQWYQIELKNINFVSHTYDIYIDGILMVTGAPFANNTVNQINEVHLYGYDPATFASYDEIKIGQTNWVTTSINTDTIIPGDSTLLEVDFFSCGLNTGVYNANLFLNSNDPLSPIDTIPLSLTVNGTPVITLSDSCLVFDTIMENTVDRDTVCISNTGCDTLFITGISNTLPEYTFTTQVSSRVNASSDDAEEIVSSGGIGLTSTDLELVRDGVDQVIGMRFQGIPVPQGATITNAYIQFECDEEYSDVTNLIINGEAVDNSTTFTTTAFDISSRTTTAANVAWNNLPFWALNEVVQSPNISSVVQEIVNRPGWNLGNSMNMIISGTGHRTAESYNGVASEAPLLVIEYVPSIMVMPPGGSACIVVDFAPTSTGTFSDFLAIQNNAGDTTVCLNGVSLPMPIISHAPDTIQNTLACCDSITDSLTIYNTGLGDLNYFIPSCDSIQLKNVLSALNVSYNNVIALIPNRYNFTDGITGTFILDGGFDMYDGGNYLNTNLGINIPYSDNIITTNVGVGPTGQYFTKKYPGLFVFAADVDGVDYFEITGNLGADGSGSANDTIITMTNPCGITYKGFVKRVYGAGDPSVNHLIIVEDNPALSHTWATNTDNDQHRVTGMLAAGTTRIYYLLYAAASGGYINGPDHEAIMVEFLNTIQSGTIFSVTPNTGTVLPGDSANVLITMNSCGKNVGSYPSNVLINSNDPLNNPDTLIAIMDVVGAPAIDLSDFCLDLDSIMEWTIHQDTLYVKNTGCDTLFVSNISNLLPEYTVDTSNFYVLVGDSMPVVVTFSPSGVGTFYDTLTILSNDVDTTVCLEGDAFARPILSVQPDSIFVTVPYCCDTVIDSLTIYNTGGSPLVWNITSPTNFTDDFDPGIDTPLWSVNTGVANTSCGSVSGNALHFSNTGSRNAATIDLNTSGGGNINFNLFISNGGGAPCENADIGEDVVLEYSINGGGTYTLINTYAVNSYPVFTFISEAIPLAAQTTASRFRWRQLANSGSCCDHWAIDDVSIQQFSNSEITYIPDTGTTLIGDSSKVQLLIHPCSISPGNFTYEVVVNSNDPITIADTIYINITKDTLPPAPTAVDTFACFGNPIPDLVATTAGDSVMWYSDVALTTLVNVGDTFVTGQTAAGVYTYYITTMLNNCEGLPDSVSLTINAVPNAPIGADVPVCEGNPIPSLTVVGAGIILWYDDPALTNLVFTGNPFPTGNTTSGIYTYYAIDSVGGCSSLTSDTVVLTISPLPPPPVSMDTTVCNGAAIPDLTATGTNINWYTDPNLTINVFSGNPYATGQTLAGVYTYYVTQNPTGCESLADTVTLTISSTSPPTASNDSVCDGGVVPDLVATGTNIKWYSDAGLTTLVFTGSPYATGQTAIGVYTYYVTQTVGGCESAAATVTLSINAIPNSPIGSDTNVCFGYPIPDLSATGTNIQWYSDATLTTLVFTGNPYATGQTTIGAYTYYATQSVSGCEGPSDTIVLNINAVPVTPTALDTTICFGDPTPDLTATGTNIHWYDDAALTNEVALGSPFATGQTLAGTYTYYVTDSTGGCHSISDTVILTINNPPAIPTALSQQVCFGLPTPDLTSTGTFIQWYSDAGLTALVNTGSPYATGQTAVATYTYYVTDSVEACPASASQQVDLTIHPLPNVPVGTNEAICFGSPVPDLTAVGTNLQWYSDAALTTLVFTGSPFATGQTAVGVYTYYVTQTDTNICESLADTVTLTISVTSPPIANDTAICDGSPTPDLTAVGTNIQWYSDAALTTLVFTGSPYATGQTAVGVYTYYVTQTLSGCESAADTVTLTINAIPAAPVSSNDSVCFLQPTPDLVAVGTNIQWYSDAALTTLVFTGSPFATGQTTVGIYTYYVTQTIAGCESPSTTVTLSINASPVAPTSNDELICFGSLTPDLTAIGTNIQWYSDAALTTLVFTGSPFATGQTVAGVYTYYVTQTVAGCEGPADTVTLTISAQPVTPNATDTAICFGSPTPDLSAVGTILQWYDDAALTNLVNTGTLFATGQIAVGTYTYYLTDSTAGCLASNPDTVILTINAIPGTPTAFNDSTCFGSPTPDLTAIGTNIQWYSDAGLTTLVGTGSPYVTGQTAVGTYTYYITQIVAGCEGLATQVDLIINAIPTAPTSANATVCENNPVPDLTATGTNIQWYSDAALTTLVFTGSPFATGQTTVGIYTYYVTQTIDGCESPSTTVTLTINGLPNAPIASNDSVCFGTPTPDLTAVGTNLQWYSDAALTTLVGTGSPFATGQTAVGIYTYYVTQTDVNTCKSLADTVTLTINAIPVAPMALDTNICFGDPTPDLTATGTNIQWYSDAALTTLVFTGSPFATGKTALGTYTYYVTQTVASCESLADTSVLSITTFPSSPSANNDTVCEGNPVPDLIAIGTNITWYDDVALTNIVGAGSPFATGQTASGVYTYYVTDSLNGCGQSPATTVVLTINALPAAPISNNDSTCFGTATPDLTAVGTNIQWYSDAALTTLVFIGNPFSTGQTAVGIYTYYVTQTDANTCESLADTVALTINAIPSVPIANNDSACLGTTIPDLTAVGTNVQWYSDAALTTLVFTGSPFVTGQTAVGVYTYYVTQSILGCESLADTVTLTINALPTTPTAANDSACFGTTIPDLIATGTNVEWYSDATLTTLVGTGSPFATGQTAVGVYTYYVTQTNASSCESLADTVTLIINALPTTPTATNDSACFGTTIPDLTATGTNVQWYSDAALTTLVGTGSLFATGQTVVGVYTYYVTQTDASSCESLANTVTLTINALPTTPTATNDSACFGTTIPDLTAVGTNVQWYLDAALTTLVFTGSPFVTGQTAVGVYTYYVTQTDASSCESLADTVTLTINALPTTPIVANDSACFGTTIPDLTASGTNVQWYSDATLTTLVGTGSPFATGQTAVGIYTYYVTQTNTSTCESLADTVTLTINGLPSVPTATNDSTCFGTTIPDLTATGTNVQWYSDAALTTLVSTGSPFATGQTAVGVYIYYVTQTNVSSCEGLADTVTLTINAIPTAPVASNQAICFGFPTPDLTATGTNVQWYSDIALTTLVGTGSPFATGQTVIGSYVYYTTQIVNGCESPATMVTLDINNAPLGPVANDTTICFGDPTPDLTATGVSLQWYDDAALSNLVATGSPFVTGLTASGVYTFYVTQSGFGCESVPDTVVLTINAMPSIPVVSDTAICFGDPTPNLMVTGTNIQWYSNAALTTLVGIGSPFATGQTTVGSYTYYVTDSVQACAVSLADTVTLIINAIPSVPVANNDSVCFGLTTPDLTAIGSNINWYNDTALTNLVGTGNIFSTGETAIGVYTYYLTQTVNNCSSSSDTVTLGINPVPTVPISANDSACFGTTIPDLAATGTNIQWYSDAALTTLVGTGSLFATGQTVVGIYTYYVTQTNVNNCESVADTVTLTINAIPSAPVGLDEVVCESSTIPNLTATGTNIQWYSDASLTTLVGTGSSYATGQSLTGIYTYYATQSNGGCEGIADTITLTINAIPPTPIANDTGICSVAIIPNLTATGINVQWYDDVVLSNLVNTGNIFPTGQTTPGVYPYYVIDSLNGCASLVDTVTLTIFTTAPPPIASNVTACFGSIIPSLNANGSNLAWYDDIALTNLVWSGNPFPTGQTAIGTYTYYVTDSISGCGTSSVTTVLLDIISLPATPVANDTTICEGTTIPDLTATGTALTWYDDVALTNVVGTGNPFATGQTTIGTYTYFVTQTLGCESSADTVELSILAAPNVNAGFDATICLGDSIQLSASGFGIVSYNWSPIANLSNPAVATPFASPTTTTSYVVNATNTDGCSALDTVVVNVNISPPCTVLANPTATAYTVCSGACTNIIANPSSGTAPYQVIWDNGVPTGNGPHAVCPLTTTTYTAMVIDAVNDTTYGSVTITVGNVPTVDAGLDTNVCAGESIFLNATGAINYAWIADPTLSDTSVYNPISTPLTFTMYFVTGTDVNGCIGTDSVSVGVNAAASPPIANDVSVCFGTPIPDLTAIGTNITWYNNILLTNIVSIGSPFATGQTAVGTYNYYVTDSLSGCGESSATPVILTISTAPTNPTVADTTVCFGNVVTFTNSGLNPHWYSNNGTLQAIGNTFTPNNQNVGIYNYLITDTVTGCPMTAIDSFSLIVNPNPLVTINYNSVVLNPGDSILLNAYNANTYNWAPPSGLNITTGSIVTATPLVTTTYVVTGTALNGCSNSDSVIVLVVPVSVDEHDLSNNLLIYPNPARDGFTLEFNAHKDLLSLSMVNALGQLIYKEALDGLIGTYVKRFDMKDNNSGVYFIKFVTKKGIISKRVVILPH